MATNTAWNGLPDLLGILVLKKITMPSCKPPHDSAVPAEIYWDNSMTVSGAGGGVGSSGQISTCLPRPTNTGGWGDLDVIYGDILSVVGPSFDRRFDYVSTG